MRYWLLVMAGLLCLGGSGGCFNKAVTYVYILPQDTPASQPAEEKP